MVLLFSITFCNNTMYLLVAVEVSGHTVQLKLDSVGYMAVFSGGLIAVPGCGNCYGCWSPC